jgi:hypothetical protein
MWKTTTPNSRGERWYWPAWAAAFLGFPIGGAAAYLLLGPIETAGTAAIAGAVAGAAIGVAQWLVLRRRLPLSAMWVLATACAMAIGLGLGHVLLGDDTALQPLLLRGVIVGMAIGAAQAALLRGVLPTPLVWAVVVTVAWGLGWAVTAAAGIDLPRKWAVFGASGALTFQLVTGLTLAYLLRRNDSAVTPAPAVARVV